MNQHLYNKGPLELPKQSMDTYRRLIRFAKPYTSRLVVGILCGILFAGSQTALLPVLREAFRRFFEWDQVQSSEILAIAVALIIVSIIRGIGFYFSMYLIQWVGNRVVYDLRNMAFRHLIDSSVQFFNKSRTGELITRIVNDTQMIERAVSTVLGDIARQPFSLLGAAGFLVYLNWKLAVLSLVVFPVCILPVTIFGRKVRRFSRLGQNKLGDLASIIHEIVFGVKIVKAFGMEPYENQRFDKRSKEVFTNTMKVTRSQALIEPVIVMISVFGLIGVMYYAFLTRMPLEDVLTFAVALMAMYDPAKKLSKIHLNIQRSSASADRIFEILDTTILLKDSPGAVPFTGDVETVVFKDVHFAYEEKPVLQGINLRVTSGQCIALVGSSGSGKTTMVNLIPRFFDPTAGRVEINGRNIRDFSVESLRKLIGLVTQETILFNDTVTHNITYGSDSVSIEQVRAAAQRANALSFIEALPEKFDTVIGERGVSLSGGQCQRLSIARAILRNPPILILDEATNALDAESERLVQTALDQLMKDRTVFVIAHRLSTIVNADCILVMDKGRIAESGTHAELLAKGGLYRRLYELQFNLATGS